MRRRPHLRVECKISTDADPKQRLYSGEARAFVPGSGCVRQFVTCASELRRLAGWVGALAALTALAVSSVPAQTLPTADRVAIFYDGPAQPLAEGFLDAHQIQNLLGHFGLTGEVLPIAEYQPGQLSRYRAAFFLGTAAGTRFPEGFLADVRATQKPFCWINRHIGNLLDTREAQRSFGFRYVDYRDDLEFREVVYKGVTLPKEDPDLNIVAITNPEAVRVLATAVNDVKVRYPYALRRGRFWYFADTPFSYVEEGDRYLVFCDLLHDILEIDHAQQALALVRIEDVSPDIDPADLRALADLMSAQRIPFQVAVIPIFRNPAKGFEVRLSDRPALVEAIQYMIARGGTPVLHGVTHQYRGVSADDYEFWDAMNNRPIPGDSREAVLRRLDLGLREVFASGVFPVAFETPHYAASEAAYRALNEVFTLFNERTMATPDISSIQFFPYPTIDCFGRHIVPENLGYVEAENPDPRVLVQRARNLRVVRDAVASFYFHPFLDPALLTEVLRGVSGLGYRFVSLRSFGGEVNQGGRFAVRSSSGSARVSLNGEFWRLRVYDAAGRLVEERSSPSRRTGAVEVAIQVPPGGWAAVDPVQEQPQQASGPDWLSQLRQWWHRVHPTQRTLGSVAERFSSGRASVLWLPDAAPEEARNQESYRSVLQAFGYDVDRIQLSMFSGAPRKSDTVLVIPEAAGRRLSEAQQKVVLNYLSRGGFIVADGRQAWLSSLGFHWTGWRVPVSAVTDVLFPEMPLRWRPEALVERFTAPEGVQLLMVDGQSKQPLALAGEHGAGRYVYLAAPLDPNSSDGTSRYPYLAEYMSEGFRTRRALSSPRLEAYFDPSYREGVGLNRLAAAWRQAGVRTIYAAAWKFAKGYSYDYGQLIRACHRNGISVYAWLILPAVTPKMWDEHPEWRERTAAGTDGRPGWRQLMNLENPACFRGAMDWMKATLQANDWDGVNLTELNYDADFTDYLRPDRFVPMNDDVRASFRKKAGFDPAALFDPASRYYHKRDPKALEEFLRYREDIVTAWHRRVLGELEPLARSRGWEVIVTMLDSLHSTYVRPAVGIDSRRIAALMREFDFTLQVEDSAEHWRRPPDRYRRFAETYLRLVPDRRRLMFDINVVPDRSVDGTSLPSSRATGTELALTVAAAAAASGRVAIYSEHTVASQDWALIGAALAEAARVQVGPGEWTLRSPRAVRLVSYEDRDYYLNGRLWPAVSPDGVTAPAGSYRLDFNRPWYQFLNRGELSTRLLHINADLLDARATPTGLALRYSSPGRAVLLLNQKPLSVRVDEHTWPASAEEGEGRWAVVAPRGEHTVEVETATRAGVFVGLWSYVSSSAIAAFGALTSILMIAIYLHLRWRRLARRGGAA